MRTTERKRRHHPALASRIGIAGAGLTTMFSIIAGLILSDRTDAAVDATPQPDRSGILMASEITPATPAAPAPSSLSSPPSLSPPIQQVTITRSVARSNASR